MKERLEFGFNAVGELLFSLILLHFFFSLNNLMHLAVSTISRQIVYIYV